MILNLALVAILLVVAFGVARGGLLQAIGMFFTVLVAASLASGWYEPVVAALEKSLTSYKYFLDVAAIWLLFGVTLIVLGAVVQVLTRKKGVFRPPVEMIGSILVGLMAAWTVVEFAAFSLHTAPLRTGTGPSGP